MQDGIAQSISAQPTAARSKPLRQLEVKLYNESIVDIPSPAYVLGVFDNVNPTGTARAVDAVLGGSLSQLVQDRMFGSRMGEIFIMPTPRQRTLAEMVVFVGLGPLEGFTPKVLEYVAENLARVAATARMHTLTTVPIGSSAGLKVEESARAFSTGFLRGLETTDTDHEFRSLQVCEIDEGRFRSLVTAITAARDGGFFTQRGVDLAIREGRRLSPRPAALKQQDERGRAESRPDPIYLQARTRQAAGESVLEYCVLTADLDASIAPHEHRITPASQQEAGKILEKARTIDAQLGQGLAAYYVPEATRDIMRQQLERRPDAHVVVIHDQGSAFIPWEVLHFGERCPAMGAGLSRKYLLPAQRLGGRSNVSAQAKLKILLIVDPTQDLAGAKAEGDKLLGLLRARGEDVTPLFQTEATRANVLKALNSAEFDVLHYAGHADFEDTDPAKSGVDLADGRLTAADLSNAVIAPQLVFLNACESGRVRKREATVRERLYEDLTKSVSLAEIILQGGVRNFIGTYWPVNDTAALRFSEAFYDSLLKGEELAPALRIGREDAMKVNKKDWANYLHFGNPSYRLRRPAMV
jgi:hypothetical protein